MPANSGPDLSQSASSVESFQINPIEDLQQRLAKVEELLGVSLGRKSSETAHVELPISLPPLIRTETAQTFQSDCYGEDSRITLLKQFVEIRDFLNDMGEDDQMMAYVKQVKFLQSKYSAIPVPPRSVSNFNCSQASRKLWEYLPPKSYCDRLVTIYFRSFECCVRILHRPTFMRQYEELWLSDNWELCSPSIIPQLTALLTIAYHVDDATPNDESHINYLGGAALDLVQTWLDRLDRKQRTELSTLQVDILLQPSRHFREPNAEKLWSNTGAIVRSAMLMGLHLDPKGMKDISPYQLEMRRRLWATVLEVDLQTSMLVDLPLIVPELNSYHPVPSNLNDEDFDEHTKTLPIPHPLSDLTDSLFQVCLAAALPCRIKAVSLIQRSTPDTKDVLEIGRKIGECLSSKPAALCLHYSQSAPSDGYLFSNHVQLDLHIQRTLQYLYRPLLFKEQPYTTALAEIRRHCLESTMVILSYNDLHMSKNLTPVVSKPLMRKDFFNGLWKVDLLWAGLTMCQLIRLFRIPVPTGTPYRERGHDENVLVKIVERTVDYFVDRIGRQASDLKEVLFLSLALKWVQLPHSQPDKHYEMYQHARQVLATCVDRLLQPLISQSGDRRDPPGHCPYLASPPTKRPRTLPPSAYLDSNATIRPSTTGASAYMPLHFYSEASRTNEAASWLTSFPALAVGYSDYRIDMYDNAYDSFSFGATHDWNWGSTWR
ncbi:Zn2Cys6 transcription factor [Pyrenophora tritici-repentis]|uniref:Fungal specific transcription factor domain containing protein n=2 Tax=Pyrenophora tritici-repentis TaxID=45151 RepID=A0A2W1GA81_9PLEO|nr:uncharacterized protein PTRG_11493 [Pyrenophora tritici-repentis Pt-1C-BFP]KAA8624516.1 Zn2Cys6 transcription factor [Pyrenophora tritici-repentis]EDU44543.1 conserved hypothetical protein [Pyrenophora tritici-repentis Pt-1C-BFP]KAF7452917.1 Zn2Cys6 transcription factor [Pyrenophora tritici-repentis]KAF7575957.1 Zn2Cys6 transcription factor [Pyrenophora tritici-repentis]KAI0571656.1 Zn2Cys6 transcription factor [Pyrenophora tritici-repentis]